MKKLNLSSKNFDYIRSLLEKDAEEIALDISFFEQLNINPTEFIDERYLLCQEFGFDFWNYIAGNCSDFHSKQLRALYEGKDIKEFVATYEIPTQHELAQNFLQMIIRNRAKK